MGKYGKMVLGVGMGKYGKMVECVCVTCVCVYVCREKCGGSRMI